MTLTLDAATEQRLQRELATGHFSGPSELIAHALDLMVAEREELAVRRAQIVARLEESYAQSERGETYSSEEARVILAKRRIARMAQ